MLFVLLPEEGDKSPFLRGETKTSAVRADDSHLLMAVSSELQSVSAVFLRDCLRCVCEGGAGEEAGVVH